MSRWSTCRAQVEPIAALAAIFAVCLGLSLYAGVLDASLPGESRSNAAAVTLPRVYDGVSAMGIVEPDRLPGAPDRAPDGYELNATLETRGERWSIGPVPPERGDVATRRVSVRVAPADVRPGTLRVEVWS